MQHRMECKCETEIVHTFADETAKHMQMHTHPHKTQMRDAMIVCVCSLFLPSKNYIAHNPRRAYKIMAHTKSNTNLRAAPHHTNFAS